MMIQVEELAKQAKKLKGCKKGINQLKNCKTVHEMFDCLYDYIDYCIAKEFPSNETLLKYDKSTLHAAGIYIDERLTISSPRRLLLINSDAKVQVGGYDVCRIYATGSSKITVESGQRAVTMIDALGDSEVNVVVANEPSRVIVNLYGNAKSEGATVTNVTGLETYELQA